MVHRRRPRARCAQRRSRTWKVKEASLGRHGELVHSAEPTGSSLAGRSREVFPAAGADHEQVEALLAEAGADGAEVLRELRRLLPLKTRTEYEPGRRRDLLTTGQRLRPVTNSGQ